MFGRSVTQGYLFFALQGAVCFLLVFAIALIKDIHDMSKEGVALLQCFLVRSKAIAVLLCFLTLFIVTTVAASSYILEALMQ